MISKQFSTFESGSDAGDDWLAPTYDTQIVEEDDAADVYTFVPFAQIAEKVVIQAGIAYAVRRCHELSLPLEDLVKLMQDITGIILTDTRDFDRPVAILALIKALESKEPGPCRDAPRLAASVRET